MQGFVLSKYFFRKSLSKFRFPILFYCLSFILMFALDCHAIDCCGSLSYEKIEVKGLASQGNPQEILPVILLRSGAAEIKAEVARTYRQKATGLMFRNELKDGHGMLFVYPADYILSFWMKNTYIPLSIAFLCAEGVILEIHDMEPLSLETVHSSRPARYALETPQGWFERAGLKPGDRFDFPPDFPDGS